jgi:hypothetical protein
MKILKYYSTILDLEKEVKISGEYMRKNKNDMFEEGYREGIRYALNKFKNEVQ